MSTSCTLRLRSILCPCCVQAGARTYLRLVDNRCATTQQHLKEVEAFVVFECVKFLYLVQSEGEDEDWIPSLCARLLILFYHDPSSVEEYLPQICHLLVAFPRPCMALEVAVLHMCTRSLHFALNVHWALLCAIEDCNSYVGTNSMAVVGPVAAASGCESKKGEHDSRPARLILCVYAAINERTRSKGLPGFASPNKYLSSILEQHRGDALSSITQALCGFQGSSSSSRASASDSSPPLNSMSDSANLAGSKGSSPPEFTCIVQVNADSLQDSKKLLKSVQDHDDVDVGSRKLVNWIRGVNSKNGTFFYSELFFIQQLTDIAEALRLETLHLRAARLHIMLGRINAFLESRDVYIPLCSSSSFFYKVVRIPPDQAKVFTTATRCPYMIMVETIRTLRKCSAPDLDPVQRLRRYTNEVGFKAAVVRDGFMDEIRTISSGACLGANLVPRPLASPSNVSPLRKPLMDSPTARMEDDGLSPKLLSFDSLQEAETATNSDKLLEEAEDEDRMQPQVSRAAHIAHASEGEGDALGSKEEEQEESKQLSREIANTLSKDSHVGVSGGGWSMSMTGSGRFQEETWENKKERIRLSSPFGSRRGYSIQTVIVKSFDDVRQEAFAMQLIQLIHNTWQKEELPVKIFPYRILATSAGTGIIQGLTDAVSLDSLKQQAGFTSLSSHFQRIYGKESEAFRRATANFLQSLAGYSILCHVLQVKDRHNGNILIDSKGHMIHIDFGYILGLSPGNMGFETAPFKLTDEYVELLGGVGSESWKRFVSHCKAAFLSLRRIHHRLAALMELMMFNSNLPCSRVGKNRIVQNFVARLYLEMSNEECEKKVGGRNCSHGGEEEK
uniref:1-phosphatidylinositol 4-kinase n=1 Tax=Guillardia theta TaxID=55529 RepID=A0A7S4HA93_GUITH|mmetsp:Transcript_11880/g.40937  ORF Transcript_11880/g.40937 Transcript_11880/m.40937 type:complete len:845 (+) Transcript_11880:86-2620(+)